MHTKVLGESFTVRHKIMDNMPSKNNTAANPEEDTLLRSIIKTTLDRQDDWSQHLKDQCLCKICTCGKHMCQLHPLKFEAKMPQSKYRRDYGLPERIANCPISIPIQRTHLPHVVDRTNYQHEFPKRLGEVGEQIKNDDNLKAGGPLFGLTTYRENFGVKRSPTIAFGPTENSIFPSGIVGTGTSSYQRTFRGLQLTPTKPESSSRVIKSNSLKFMANSSYRNDFKMPRIDYNTHTKHRPSPSASLIGGADSSHKPTTYQKDFQPSKLLVCPAELESRIRISRLKI